MKNIKKIQRIDNGTQFGSFGKDAKRLFIDETGEHINSIISYLKSRNSLDNIRICDLGGGNGILSKAILKEAGEKYPKLSIDVLDIDESKFCYDNPRINYKKYDARSGLKEKYDIIVARCLLHYNTPDEQRKIFENISQGIKADGLVEIIQPIPSYKNKRRIQGLYNLISEMKDSNHKYWFLISEILSIIDSVGLKIINIEKYSNKYSINGFYKKRYSLDKNEVKLIIDYLQSDSIEVPTYIIQLKGGK